MRGTRDGPAALIILLLGAALRGAMEARGRLATGAATARGTSFGGAGRGAEKCGLGTGRVSTKYVSRTRTPAW
jgi:hypothetical protein